jgi:hypothetical protein
MTAWSFGIGKRWKNKLTGQGSTLSADCAARGFQALWPRDGFFIHWDFSDKV